MITSLDDLPQREEERWEDRAEEDDEADEVGTGARARHGSRRAQLWGCGATGAWGGVAGGPSWRRQFAAPCMRSRHQASAAA